MDGPTQDATLPGPALSRHGAGDSPGFAIRWVFPPDDGTATVIKPGATVLGRDSECAGYLPSASVSRRHAEIRWNPGGAPMLRDVASRNGVFLNGRQITQAPLRVGDVIRLGDWIGILTAVPVGGLPPWSFQQLTAGYWGGPLLVARLAPARLVAASDLSVIVQGATGTGKEGAARAIHEWSGRTGPFVAVNCAAIPENLAEGQLFGYRKGSFTGADHTSPGLIRAAHEGTLFLDEISDLPLSTQPKLLRALERREVVPLGESKPIFVDIKLVTATQESLRKAVEAKRFRADLLARLEGLTVMLPSLRERVEDIPFLLSKLLELNPRAPSPPRLDPLLVERLCLYQWPFNVRELSQFVKRVVALYPDADVLDADVFTPPAETTADLGANEALANQAVPNQAVPNQAVPNQGAAPVAAPPPAVDGAPEVWPTTESDASLFELSPDELAERTKIVRVLAESIGSQTEAAKRLGISRSNLIHKMQRLRIPRPRARMS
jgi:transcriptional regulator with PAS, ATPase and Fis domain